MCTYMSTNKSDILKTEGTLKFMRGTIIDNNVIHTLHDN